MCLAVPARIERVRDDYADVISMGVESTVYIRLIDSPRVGDYVLLHAGCAIEKIREEYFNYLENWYQDMIDRKEVKDEYFQSQGDTARHP